MSTVTEVRTPTETEKALAAEVRKLRVQLAEEMSVRKALEESINDVGPSWLQSKNAAQRHALRLLNQSVRAQRLVLSMINKTDAGPHIDAIRERFAQVAEKERLDAEAIDHALGHLG